MTTTTTTTTPPAEPLVPAPGPGAGVPGPEVDPTRHPLTRLSTWFGVAFAVCQLAVMVAMTTLVLPRAGSPGDPPLERGQRVLDAQGAYRLGNFAFMLAGTLLLGFVAAVVTHLRRADRTGTLATVAGAAATLLAFIWPLGGLFHDVAIETAASGTDLRILAGWDSIAPFSLAFSALPRVFFLGAVVLGLKAAGSAPWLQRTGVVLVPLALAGSATLVNGALFPLLALSTLGYELWVGVLAVHWLRSTR
ncbi:hypothetical protein GCM10027517_00060 [Phycicoccus ginsengisoli]